MHDLDYPDSSDLHIYYIDDLIDGLIDLQRKNDFLTKYYNNLIKLKVITLE